MEVASRYKLFTLFTLLIYYSNCFTLFIYYSNCFTLLKQPTVAGMPT